MSSLLIKGGRIIDPAQGVDREGDLLIEDGRIVGIDTGSDHQCGSDLDVFDATGLIVTPGLIDMHVELREPGFEEDETIATGVAAAMAGGFTTIACTPNTDPVIDSQASVEFVQHQARRAEGCRVEVIACVSKGRDGEQLAEIGSLTRAGAVGFSDAPAPIHNPDLMRRALEYCGMFDRPVLNHPEVQQLTYGGIMHEGLVSTILALGGLPTEAEDVMTSRDLRLAEATGGRLHLMNISSAESVDLIQRAKARDVNVTAEVAIANLILTDERLRTFDANCKTNPPLRSQRHVNRCLQGLTDGTIDVITSAHTPRAREKKMLELDQAPFGMVGLETVVSLVITHLIEPGKLSWTEAIRKLTINPATILGLSDRGSLQAGQQGDVTIIDPLASWKVDPTAFRSKSANTAFAGCELKGSIRQVVIGGRQMFRVLSC